MKIVYCINTIQPVGGQEIITVLKAKALANKGVDVWIACTEASDTTIIGNIPHLRMVDLEVRYNENIKPFPWNCIIKTQKKIKHRKRLSLLLRDISPDIVVSTRTEEYRFLPYIKGDWKIVREFHCTREYRKKSSSSSFERVLAFWGDWRDSLLYQRYDRIIVLTEEERQKYWKKNSVVRVIPNPIRFISETRSSVENKRVISIGRLVSIKNFQSLIRAFKKVACRFPDWRLDIIGQGPEKESLQQLINSEGLEGVVFLKGYSDNIQNELIASSIFAFTSVSEAFGLVIIEAMSCGLPVVSYNSPFGTREIINDGINGFLVPLGDEEMLADRICLLMGDKELRKRIGIIAAETAKKYSMDKIVEMWLYLFKEIVEKKS